MDHRWGSRVLIDLPVRISTRRYSATLGRLSDVSVSGALVSINLDARVLCRIQLTLILPHRPGGDAPIIEAYVARKQAGGLGIEWCDFAPRVVSDLLRDHALRTAQRRIRLSEFEIRHWRDAEFARDAEIATAP
jgi:hypothetical protein